MGEQEGQGQCKAYKECINPPGPDGVCDIHREEMQHRGHRRLTCAELNALGVKVFLTGASEVVSRKILGDVNAAHLDARDNGGH